jgi:hypothetical protein
VNDGSFALQKKALQKLSLRRLILVLHGPCISKFQHFFSLRVFSGLSLKTGQGQELSSQQVLSLKSAPKRLRTYLDCQNQFRPSAGTFTHLECLGIPFLGCGRLL